jgi:hypothetical protein
MVPACDSIAVLPNSKAAAVRTSDAVIFVAAGKADSVAFAMPAGYGSGAIGASRKRGGAVSIHGFLP